MVSERGRLFGRSRQRGASLEFLPPESPYTAAVEELDEFFGEASDISVVTLVFRGEAFTPDGLSQMDALLDDIIATPGGSGAIGTTKSDHCTVIVVRGLPRS